MLNFALVSLGHAEKFRDCNCLHVTHVPRENTRPVRQQQPAREEKCKRSAPSRMQLPSSSPERCGSRKSFRGKSRKTFVVGALGVIYFPHEFSSLWFEFIASASFFFYRSKLVKRGTLIKLQMYQVYGKAIIDYPFVCMPDILSERNVKFNCNINILITVHRLLARLSRKLITIYLIAVHFHCNMWELKFIKITLYGFLTALTLCTTPNCFGKVKLRVSNP